MFKRVLYEPVQAQALVRRYERIHGDLEALPKNISFHFVPEVRPADSMVIDVVID